MERKYEILNHELYQMLNIEERKKFGEDSDLKNELKKAKKKAKKIATNLGESIDARSLIHNALHYGRVDKYYWDLCINGSDDEQFSEIKNLEYITLTLYIPSSLSLAGNNLLEEKDYLSWLKLLYALKYVPLQMLFCNGIRRLEDYVEVLNKIEEKELNFPKTFFRMFFGHWFEWVWKTNWKLWSYEDERGDYSLNENAQKLKQEASIIREEWENCLNEKLDQILDLFSKYINLDIIFDWAIEQPLINYDRYNKYGYFHDEFLKTIWQSLIQKGALPVEINSKANMNLLLLTAQEKINVGDIKGAKDVLGIIRERLLEENYVGYKELSSLDIERQKFIFQLLRSVYSNDELLDFLSNIATRYNGWNIDYKQIFSEAKRESYIYCCLFRGFQETYVNEVETIQKWKEFITFYLNTYKRCDNEYIVRDDMITPFKVAIEIAQKYLNEECQCYLHDILIDNILSIVSLLSVFTVCPILISDMIADRLYKRALKEWGSARILMDVRGQRRERERMDKLITLLEKQIASK